MTNQVSDGINGQKIIVPGAFLDWSLLRFLRGRTASLAQSRPVMITVVHVDCEVIIDAKPGFPAGEK